MKYISTRGNVAPQESAQVILQGLAADGGLFVPESFPAFFPAELAELSYNDLAKRIFALYLTDFSPEDVAMVVDGAYNESSFPGGPAPCAAIDDHTSVLELWHGPTSAFKDLALQALPRLMSVARRKAALSQDIVILVATSGDTGKAALEGFKDVDGVSIIVFYPAGGVSAIQELQMLTTDGSNTYVVGVNGNFDDCQTGVKAIFGGQPFACFSSANSINWGRLLPQIVYYFYAYGRLEAAGRLRHGQPMEICVPTGNFGNILAGCYARCMGLPVSRFICASNENDVLTEALNQGRYNSRRPFYRTVSPSMDILVSSNFERFIYLSAGCDSQYTAGVFRQLKESGSYDIAAPVRETWRDSMTAVRADQKEAAAAIRQAWTEHGYLLDPHTAVAYAAAEKASPSPRREQLLIVSTASPYKFPAAVLSALGESTNNVSELALPAMLKNLSGWPVPANLACLEQLPRRHDRVVDIDRMEEAVRRILKAEG